MTLSVYGLTPIPFSDKTNIYEFVYNISKKSTKRVYEYSQKRKHRNHRSIQIGI